MPERRSGDSIPPAATTPAPATTPPAAAGDVEPAPAPTPAPSPTEPAASPTTVTLTALKRQKLLATGKLAVRAQRSRACSLSLIASVTPPAKKPKTKTSPAVLATLAAQAPQTITVTVPKTARAAVKAALRARKTVTVTVVATVTGATGAAATPATVQITLKR